MDWTVFILIPFLSSFVPFVDPLVKLRKSPPSHFARVCVCVCLDRERQQKKTKRKNKQQKTTCQLNNLKHFKNNLSRINKCIRLT